jgi:hypothetical protein
MNMKSASEYTVFSLITGFLQFFPSSSILENRNHKVSEPGTVSILR